MRSSTLPTASIGLLQCLIELCLYGPEPLLRSPRSLRGNDHVEHPLGGVADTNGSARATLATRRVLYGSKEHVANESRRQLGCDASLGLQGLDQTGEEPRIE